MIFRRYEIVAFLLFSVLMGVLSIPSVKDVGIYYFQSYRYELAYRFLSEAEYTDSEDVFILKKMKEYFIVKGNTKKALEIQENLVSLRPHNHEYLKDAEKLAGWVNDAHKKVSFMEKRARLIKDQDTKNELLFEVARSYRWLKSYEDADRVFKDFEYSTNRAYLEEVIRYYLSKKYAKKAKVILTHYLSLFPEQIDQKHFLYQTHVYLNEYEQALNYTFSSLGSKKIDLSRDKKSLYQVIKALDNNNVNRHYALFNNSIEQVIRISNDEERLSVLVAMIEKIDKNKRSDFLTAIIDDAHYILGNEIVFEYMKEFEKVKIIPFRDLYEVLAEKYRQYRNLDGAIECLERLTKRYYLNRSYWKDYAEVLSENGQKKQSAKAYLELYKLQKKKSDQSYFNDVMKGKRFADLNLNNLESINIEKRNLYLDQIEVKLVNTISEMDSTQEKIEILEEFVNENAGRKEALKSLAYQYYVIEDFDKRSIIIERLNALYPEDEDIITLVLPKWIESKNWSKIVEKKNTLEKTVDKYELDNYLLEYYYTKDRAKFEEICLSVSHENLTNKVTGLLKLKCLAKKEQNTEYLLASRELERNFPEEDEFYLMRLYAELEFGQYDWANNEKNSAKARLRASEYENYIIYLNEVGEQISRKYLWGIRGSHLYNKTDRFSYLDNSVELVKRIDQWGIAVEYSNALKLSQGDESFNVHSAKLYHYTQNYGDFSIAPRFVTGDKSRLSGVLLENNVSRDELFVSSQLFINQVLYQTLELMESKNASANGFTLYAEYRPKNSSWEHNASLRLRDVKVDNEEGIDFQVSNLSLKNVKEYDKFNMLIGTQLNVTNFFSSSEGTLVNRNFLDDSISYFAVSEVRYNEELSKWFSHLRLGVGGDLGRSVSFGQSYFVQTSLKRNFTDQSNISLISEYYSESIGLATGSNFLAGVEYQFNF